MTKQEVSRKLRSIEQFPSLFFLGKWILLSALVGILAGSASAFFLIALDWATNYREAHQWIIWLLPFGGLIIGLSYHYWGQDVVKGNNQLLEEFYSPRQIIPLKMAPLVLFGTVATHFFGGSAGREGTAVQMGGAIADQFTRIFRLRPRDRKILLIIGISAGFASVFGTPLAGAVFALEVLVIGRMRYEALLPSVLTAVIADYACRWWQVGHTHYHIATVPDMQLPFLLWAVLAGILFGLAALAFSRSTHFFGKLFGSKIKYPPLRPVLGGAVIAVVVYLMGTTKYIGLGIPTIVDAFETELPPYDFVLKIVFTAFTLGAGFKGGEVTPLFFIGATLGNALALFIPLPVALLAGMGFVAVFSGATNTPIACTIMGIELFGIQSGMFIAIACVTAYLFSGHSGIYSAQVIGSPKHLFYGRDRGKTLTEVDKRRKETS
ncbi:voltage-gated chloride channel family protein [Sinomicrobium weinanense]|uniref:Voltage-gated chloride channel family protein n=1 Tax=Sinomicrobium weinanense TaxID=2842200 RepID=A0A926JSG5_9FLAO|nr:voltage-gated chloride channel family protein [Sinomicrobium weinanense]MBC9796682.1 voltage-gated chloride channel family protein [Sinomicrobium weinanense]MBU3123043.1 voltage-gated chloride channel family protein [Sinomicrobium weinanense]